MKKNLEKKNLGGGFWKNKKKFCEGAEFIWHFSLGGYGNIPRRQNAAKTLVLKRQPQNESGASDTIQRKRKARQNRRAVVVGVITICFQLFQLFLYR